MFEVGDEVEITVRDVYNFTGFGSRGRVLSEKNTFGSILVEWYALANSKLNHSVPYIVEVKARHLQIVSLNRGETPVTRKIKQMKQRRKELGYDY